MGSSDREGPSCSIVPLRLARSSLDARSALSCCSTRDLNLHSRTCEVASDTPHMPCPVFLALT
eukprot:787851-Rhodomonas_salina.3